MSRRSHSPPCEFAASTHDSQPTAAETSWIATTNRAGPARGEAAGGGGAPRAAVRLLAGVDAHVSPHMPAPASAVIAAGPAAAVWLAAGVGAQVLADVAALGAASRNAQSDC